MSAYDAIAPVYGEYSAGRQSYLDAVDRLVIERLSPNTRLLDIGAGDGRRLQKIRAEADLSEVVAIEPSPEMAKVCRAATGVEVHECFAEAIDELDIGTFDSVTALWNVFGHIETPERRIRALRAIRSKLRSGGRVMLDVNNRHNASSYGRLNVLKRVLVDRLSFDERRGDAAYEWKIGEQSFQGRGHLFTPAEIERLFQQAGLRIEARCTVDYATGAVSTSPYKGQLYYVLTGSA